LVSPEQAAAFGAMWLLAVTITSAVGGIVALVTGDLKLLKSGKQSTPEVVQTN
jgi:hypothetical protein